MAFSDLPLEVLTDIVSGLDGNVRDLWACSLVCKRLWQLASPLLYEYVDLRCDEGGDYVTAEKSWDRQEIILATIAENPWLGSLVRKFRNHSTDSWGDFEDATQGSDLEILTKTALNMKNLTSAVLTPNPIATYIIEHLPEYPDLQNLTIQGTQAQIWSICHTALKTLKWVILGTWNPGSGGQSDPWEHVEFLEKVVGVTCPNLESLDIWVSQVEGSIPMPLSKRVKEYLSIEIDLAPKLRHFGFRHQAFGLAVESTRARHLDFVKRYRSTLKSLDIPVPTRQWDMQTLEFIQKMCSLVPNIRDVNFIHIPGVIGALNIHLAPEDFLDKLTADLASPKYEIESCSLMNIGTHFQLDVGRWFGRWKSLKKLQVRDEDNTTGPFNDDGRMIFGPYLPEIFQFMSELPPSLEALYMGINGNELMVEDDGVFAPMMQLCPGIFRTLPRLHTFDVHAWISGKAAATGEYPEKALFFRRVASRVPGKRAIWTTRMDCVYLERTADLSTHFNEVECQFEGMDADDEWVEWVRRNIAAGRPNAGALPEQDYSWPFSKNPVCRYPMFTKNS